jgi:excinuclease ABC subunit C
VPEDEVLPAFLMQFYEEVPPPRTDPRRSRSEEAKLLAEALAAKAERKVVLGVPQRGEQRACSNRRRAMPRRRSTGGWPRARPRPNCCAKSPICSSWSRAEPDRDLRQQPHPWAPTCAGRDGRRGARGLPQGQYRKFNIKRARDRAGRRFRDDARSARAPLRAAGGEDPDRKSGEWPDLLLIDGGKGQVSR